jgi:hypothetical protein
MYFFCWTAPTTSGDHHPIMALVCLSRDAVTYLSADVLALISGFLNACDIGSFARCNTRSACSLSLGLNRTSVGLSRLQSASLGVKCDEDLWKPLALFVRTSQLRKVKLDGAFPVTAPLNSLLLLREIDVSNARNASGGEILNCIAVCRNLEKLFVKDCHTSSASTGIFTGAFWPFLTHLKLGIVDLDGTEEICLFQSCSNVFDLAYRGARSNLIHDHFPKLRSLDLRYNRSQTDFSLHKCKTLTSLDTTESRFEFDSSSLPIATLQHLRVGSGQTIASKLFTALPLLTSFRVHGDWIDFEQICLLCLRHCPRLAKLEVKGASANRLIHLEGGLLALAGDDSKTQPHSLQSLCVVTDLCEPDCKCVTVHETRAVVNAMQLLSRLQPQLCIVLRRCTFQWNNGQLSVPLPSSSSFAGGSNADARSVLSL